MARKYSYWDGFDGVYWPAAAPPLFQDWDRARDTANYNLLCAEMSRVAYAGRREVTEALESIGFTLRCWIEGRTPVERRETLGTNGFIATSEAAGLTVLAFRGNESNKPEDLLADGFANSEPWDENCPSRGQVNAGFANVYGRVRKAISEVLEQQGGTLLITGHGLGAALATLAAAEHAARQPKLISFGSPRVGDRAFARSLNGLAIHRFVNCCDLVTRIPPEQFTQPQIETLLSDLVPERSAHPLVRALVPAVALGLFVALRNLGIQPHYVHVGEPEYRDRTGKALRVGTTETVLRILHRRLWDRTGKALRVGTTVAEDQRTARAEYPWSRFDEKDLLETLLSAATAAASAERLRDALRTFGGRRLRPGGVGPWLRDLSDHAPINYVSIFTGRRPD